jgi:hypothetical protein
MAAGRAAEHDFAKSCLSAPLAGSPQSPSHGFLLLNGFLYLGFYE